MIRILNLIQLVLVIIILILIIIPAITTTHISPVVDSEGNLVKNLSFSLQHPLGTDYYGEDIFQKLCIATYNNIKYAFVALICFLGVGIPLGVSLGFKDRSTHLVFLKYYIYKKRYSVLFFKVIQNVAAVVIHALQSIPIIIAITIVVIINQLNISQPELRIYADMLFLGIFLSPKIAVTLANHIEVLRNEEYIQAAKGLGISRFRLLTSHILWMESRGSIILQSMNLLIQAVMVEVLLSYFRFGPDGISIGNMISNDIENLTGMFSGSGAVNQLDLYQATAPFCLLIIFSISMRWLGLKAIELSE
jgi:ABC-type dipeptide/oligopeptide/nickel transport system permease subunit